MPAKRKTDEYAEKMKETRNALRMTQAELAAALGISAKAIQSYEQGWRNVPKRVMIQLFVLLAINKRGEKPSVPCWKLRRCSARKREACPGYTIASGDMCWFVTAGSCSTPDASTDKGALPCVNCPVISRLLKA